MSRFLSQFVKLLFVSIGLLGSTAPARCQVLPQRNGAIESERVVAGSPRDFMEVRHLVLRGSNVEIGKSLAGIAQERFGYKPFPSADAFRTKIQRRYIEKNYPILHERMSGAAAASGRRVDDDAWNFGGLWYLFGAGAGCSGRRSPVLS